MGNCFPTGYVLTCVLKWEGLHGLRRENMSEDIKYVFHFHITYLPSLYVSVHVSLMVTRFSVRRQAKINTAHFM